MRWAIRLKDREGERIEVFDRVVVTTGPHTKAWAPDIPGQEDFQGEMIHSQAYKK